ncbi:hypothetical protein DICPUDRAFT_156190 [Dictyostelium purpureum]|uniref:Uncharacterized protein n=1 Tax=Dictyostelium purpureum TaxID=5786 RepID=F0ZVY3_DICPU|nr:uncharacterized protein DICPUDRAFT_156190 [Dictyostelium purpureum]EGC31903.1 hypothetical protein DICPUDRAFT_156190 [Dictyostelium purpureum]|eukprot:XP_003291573.1 hypothetical protein DICPUDRAFT_156190 [Dictyostelium purpureum]
MIFLIHPTFSTAAATTINQFYFYRNKFKHKIIGLLSQKKIWSLLEITTTAAPEPTTFSLQNSNSNYNLNSELKSPPNYVLLLLKTLNIGNIREVLYKFNSNRADYPKITYEVIKKCLKLVGDVTRFNFSFVSIWI